MSVTATCGDCGKRYRLDDKYAGRRMRCKGCGGAVEVPQLTEGDAPAPRPVKATAPPAPRKSSSAAPAGGGDPFNDMDALLALEAGGTAAPDEPMPVATPARRSSGAATPPPY